MLLKEVATKTTNEIQSMRVNFKNNLEVNLLTGERLELTIQNIVNIGNGSSVVLINATEGSYAITFEDNVVFGDWMLAFNCIYNVRSLAYIKK